MCSILALSLLITLCGFANAATVHHAHRRHAPPNQGMIASDPASGFAYAPPGPPMHYRAAPYNNYNVVQTNGGADGMTNFVDVGGPKSAINAVGEFAAAGCGRIGFLGDLWDISASNK
jgi:hypothetical protein